MSITSRPSPRLGLGRPAGTGFRSRVLGPDGSLYAAVDEGEIHKMTPQ